MNTRLLVPSAALTIVAACAGRVAADNCDLERDPDTYSPLPSTGGSGGSEADPERGEDSPSSSESNGGFGGGCPPLPGPTMVQFPVLQNGAIIGGGFCIDSTEVTRSQYQAWLGTLPSTQGQPPSCIENQSFTPSCAGGGVMPDTSPHLPQVCVDWCDAYAYCNGVGKRLCGAVSGGSTPYDAYADPNVSAWSFACTSNGANHYSYGDAFDEDACQVEGDIQPVASSPDCQSSSTGFNGVYDLNGNVAEWEDACNGTSGLWDTCRQRGGGTYGIVPDETTDCGAGGAGGYRGEGLTVVGFRCCWP